MALLVAFSFVGFLKSLLMVVFVLSALLLVLVVLLQEPKGGGLSSAFGGAGAETFGVQTGSVNRFTAWVAGIFMFSALMYAAIQPDAETLPTEAGKPLEEDDTKSLAGDPANADPANGGEGAPADDGAEKGD